MDKIKIGLLGASAITTAFEAVQTLKKAELFCIYDTNADMLDESIKYAKSNGFYIKKFNNSDDFYSASPNIILATKNMYEYINSKYTTLLLDGSCSFENVYNGLYMQNGGSLYVYNNGWKNAILSDIPLSERLPLLKNQQNITLLFFKLFVNGGISNGR